MHMVVESGCLIGMERTRVQVEVHVGRGLPGFEIVGLAEKAVRESRVRVKAALANAGVEIPARHIVLNLAPGDVKKHGASLDLAIAVALLMACDTLQPELVQGRLFLGELSLMGELRPVRGVLAQLVDAQRRGLEEAFIPGANAAEASLTSHMRVLAPETLRDVIEHLSGRQRLPSLAAATSATPGADENVNATTDTPSLPTGIHASRR